MTPFYKYDTSDQLCFIFSISMVPGLLTSRGGGRLWLVMMPLPALSRA